MSVNTQSLWQALRQRVLGDSRYEPLAPWMDRLRIHSLPEGRLDVVLENESMRPLFTQSHLDLLQGAAAEELGRPAELSLKAAVSELLPLPCLNQNLTFDNLVSGPSNRLACAASRAVCSSPGNMYNPLFIHSSLGMGKTHVLQAICHELRSQKQNCRMFCASAKEFINLLSTAIRQGRQDEFRQLYRELDVLAIDDIHFLAGDDKAQEEFLSIFNALFDRQCQIILTADQHPKDINNLGERLSSRFKWGMVLEIEAPSLAMRLALIEAKMKTKGMSLPAEIVSFLAENITRNVRELEGALLKLTGYSSLLNHTVDLESAKRILSEHLSVSKRTPNIDDIQKVVCSHFHISANDLLSPTRAQSVSFPRQIAMFLSRELTTSSLEEVGNRFGGRDHSTVKYGQKKMKNLYDSDPRVRSIVESIRNSLLNLG